MIKGYKLFIGTTNDAELSIYSDTSCTNQLDTVNLCGAYSNMDMLGTTKSKYYSIRVVSKPGLCKFRHEKINCN
ncbi:hypothetical protein AYI70_g575 [Smittium culicis]|uniref:Uncharacterized protein n=1 Tax=Smittium culicis TaxID=133412 RepID=A0A1R1YGR6_9FUNG|nr:hypothetical protein AYI70_g575 [Smittium culicis]